MGEPNCCIMNSLKCVSWTRFKIIKYYDYRCKRLIVYDNSVFNMSDQKYYIKNFLICKKGITFKDINKVTKNNSNSFVGIDYYLHNNSYIVIIHSENGMLNINVREPLLYHIKHIPTDLNCVLICQLQNDHTKEILNITDYVHKIAGPNHDFYEGDIYIHEIVKPTFNHVMKVFNIDFTKWTHIFIEDTNFNTYSNSILNYDFMNKKIYDILNN